MPLHDCCRLVSVPELGYLTTTLPPQGEIVIRAPEQFCGQFMSHAANTHKFQDGWFHTGDIGEWDQDTQQLRVIGRKTNVIKLSQGEFVALENIEQVLENSLLLEQVCVFGDSLQDELVAVVIPKRCGGTTMPSAEEVLEEFRRLCSEDPSVRPFEMPAAVFVEDCAVAWTADNGCLTTTNKKCRHNLKQKYETAILQLYLQLSVKRVLRLESLEQGLSLAGMVCPTTVPSHSSSCHLYPPSVHPSVL